MFEEEREEGEGMLAGAWVMQKVSCKISIFWGVACEEKKKKNNIKNDVFVFLGDVHITRNLIFRLHSGRIARIWEHAQSGIKTAHGAAAQGPCPATLPACSFLRGATASSAHTSLPA